MYIYLYICGHLTINVSVYVLFCIVLFCFVLFCFVLFCLVFVSPSLQCTSSATHTYTHPHTFTHTLSSHTFLYVDTSGPFTHVLQRTEITSLQLQLTLILCNSLQPTAIERFSYRSVCHICCNTLKHTATIKSLHIPAYHCNTVVETSGRLLQHAATHCNILQHTATHCNWMQLPATHCNAGGNIGAFAIFVATLWNTHCNSLQLTATHCNILVDTLGP